MAYEEVVPQVWRGRGTPTAAAARRRATEVHTETIFKCRFGSGDANFGSCQI